MQRRLRLLLSAIAVVAMVVATWPVGPATANHNTDNHSANMTHEGTSPQVPGAPNQNPFTNSDLSFWGDRAIAGNYKGFRVIDISDPKDIENPARVLADVDCQGAQSDVAVWDNDGDPEADLVFTSVDAPRNNPSCASAGTTASDPNSWEGVRIFDINNLAAVQQVAAVPTDCGSHTHTLVPDPADPNFVYIYVSSYPLGSTAVTTSIPARPDVDVNGTPVDFPAGVRSNGTECLEPEPGEAKQNGYHNKISIIKVDLTNPAAADDFTFITDPGTGEAKGLSYPAVKEVPMEGGTEWTHRMSGDRSFDFTGCHDMNAFTGVKVPGTGEQGMIAGACWKEGVFWDISDPWNPDYVNSVENEEIRSLFHSATWTWDGKVVAFEDEAGGGGDDRCRDPEDLQGRMWFYSVRGGRLLGSFKIPRSIEKGANCTAHNYNYLPLSNGKYVMASAWYQGGTSMIDTTNPAKAKEVGFYDADSPINGVGGNVKSNAWSSYWYNGYVFVNDISRGLEVLSFNDPLANGALTLPYLNSQTQENIIPQTYTFASRLTLRYSRGAFRGRLFSNRAECQDDRNIRIKKRRPGPDRTVASDTTDASGRYAAPYSSHHKGRFYAVASEKTFSEDVHTVVCSRARSRSIRRR